MRRNTAGNQVREELVRHGKEFCGKLQKTTLYDLFLENYSGCCVDNKLQEEQEKRRDIS